MATTLTPANAATVIRRLGGIEVKPVSSEERGLVMGIYGEPGVGKTTVAASITDSEFGRPALYIDARGNPHVIASYADKIDVVSIASFGQLEAVRQDLLKGKEQYKTVIIDTLTEAWAIDLRDLYNPTADVSWQMYSAVTRDLEQTVRNFTDLSTMGPKMNVVFVMQQSVEERVIMNQKVSRFEINFNKALQESLPSLISFLGRMYYYEVTPPFGRVLDFSPAPTLHQAKLQKDRDDPASKDMPYLMYDPSLAPILDAIRGHIPWPTEAHSKPKPKSTQKPATP
jgi:hypothetical protein